MTEVSDHCEGFTCLDELAVDHIASFLNLHSIYRWVCASKGAATDVLSPEWFFRKTLVSPDEFEILPLDETAQERFYLAETVRQMRKCRFIPKFCYEHSSGGGIQHIAKWLEVDPASVYVERIAMLMERLVWIAQKHAHPRNRLRLQDFIAAARVFGFRCLPQHDRIFQFDFSPFESHRFTTITEWCALQYESSGNIPFVDCSSASVFRAHMCGGVEKAMMLEFSDDTLIDVISYDLLLEPCHTIDMENDDGVDIEDWLMGSLTEMPGRDGRSEEYQQRHGFSVKEQAKIEFNKYRETLQALHREVEHYEMEDFGVCIASPQLSSDGLVSYMRDQSRDGLRYTDSAFKFVQLLIEEVHFGSVVEVKVKKQGSIKATWDYGVLFGTNGTTSRNLRLSDDEEDQMTEDDDDDDEDYVDGDDALMEDA